MSVNWLLVHLIVLKVLEKCLMNFYISVASMSYILLCMRPLYWYLIIVEILPYSYIGRMRIAVIAVEQDAVLFT